MTKKKNIKRPTKKTPAKNNGKHPGGAPTKYSPRYCRAIIDYFDVPAYTIKTKTITTKRGKKKYIRKETVKTVNDLPILAAFAHSIGVCKDTLNEWCKVHPEFSDAYKRAKDMQEIILTTNGLRGNYEQAYSIFTAKNVLGWRDKQEIEHSGNSEFPVRFIIKDAKRQKS